MRPQPFLVVASLLLAACQGIPPSPTSPTAPPAAPAIARAINLTVNPGMLPVGGGSATVYVEVLAVNGTGVPNAAVSLSASGGALDAEQATTDATGHAKVRWAGTATGTVTARLGELVSSMAITVDVPPVLPPPSNPPPPAPEPPPLPPPTPAPVLPTLAVVGPATVNEGAANNFRADVQQLAPGERVLAYEWDLGDGDPKPDAITSGPVASLKYDLFGVYTLTVTARTNDGRRIVGTMQVIVLSS